MSQPTPVPIDYAPLRAHKRRRAGLQVLCVAISLFMAIPIYLIAVAAFSSRAGLNVFPQPLWPQYFDTETMATFLASTGVLAGFINSLYVGIGTLLVSTLVGAPAGYALARFAFRGKDPYQLFLLFTRALPIVVLSVPLASVFLTAGIFDTPLAVILLHTALALPTTILITASVFVSVPVDAEEAARIFGCSPVGAFVRVVLPLALPGIAAASIFTFVTSWNEVLGATILTFTQRTIPALVLSSLSDSPMAFRFAGGFVLVLPALLFIAVMRKYLLNMWGTTIR
ncbi:MAG: carbohydrate ABC transporter permease [Propionicimonas sp.]|uniref:carbohydrate ABC transporter permease n=1 Tax=Propionicimonas sp. TaxID=1955623 RepID=UPI002B215ADC|nr:carbohydrate ABC transporter permease [Propionicimonas sp.]MEA4944829.1 carbohydrate ABC transporter permease [Propionicimonas sp.]MEA5054173.1 carbohydrate ABC transporter permease [Propionicimonas sp.]MEA5116189.1 carbohydrate ABC transporter permease [Propionicimonas sp.]